MSVIFRMSSSPMAGSALPAAAACHVRFHNLCSASLPGDMYRMPCEVEETATSSCLQSTVLRQQHDSVLLGHSHSY